MNKFQKYIKRLGIGAFLFFLIKGLVWIAIFLGLGEYFMSDDFKRLYHEHKALSMLIVTGILALLIFIIYRVVKKRRNKKRLETDDAEDSISN